VRTSPGATPWVAVSIRETFAWDQPSWCASAVVDKPAATRRAPSCSASRRRAVSPAAGSAGVTRDAAFPTVMQPSRSYRRTPAAVSPPAMRQPAMRGRRPTRPQWREQHRSPRLRSAAPSSHLPHRRRSTHRRRRQLRVLVEIIDPDVLPGRHVGGRLRGELPAHVGAQPGGVEGVRPAVVLLAAVLPVIRSSQSCLPW
jgi:hypothetical protein